MLLALTKNFRAMTNFLLIVGSMAIIDRMTKFFQTTPNIFSGRPKVVGHYYGDQKNSTYNMFLESFQQTLPLVIEILVSNNRKL